MATEASYKGHQYPVEIISHCVWLYYRFALSLRDISEMMLERGVVVSHETVRQWCAKFGQGYANQLRQRRPRPGDKWHVDEVFIRITESTTTSGAPSTKTATSSTSWCSPAETLWPPRSSSARPLKGLRYVPRVLVIDKLASHRPAHRVVMPSVKHRQSKYCNNLGPELASTDPATRAGEETVHLAPACAGPFLSAFSRISPRFRPRRHLLSATGWRHEMADRFTVWNQITGVTTTAA